MYLVSPLEEEEPEVVEELVAAAAAEVEVEEAAATFCATEELVGTPVADEERVDVSWPATLVGAARTDEEVVAMDE